MSQLRIFLRTFLDTFKLQDIVSKHFKQFKILNSPQIENRFCQNIRGIILNI